jgi:Lon protease-like protein
VDGLLIPLFPLEVVLYPGQPLPLHIFEDRYKEMIGECLESKSEFGVVLRKENAIGNVGCTATITNVVKRYDDGRMDIETTGVRRFEVLFVDDGKSYLRAAAQFLLDEDSEVPADLRARVLGLYQEAVTSLVSDAADRQRLEADPDSPSLSFALIGPLPVDLDFKQTLLPMRSERERLERVVEYLGKLNLRLRMVTRVRHVAGSNGQGR